jgi:hypothetical protein
MKAIFNVEQIDLVGCIKDFPIEVVEKMIEEQFKQGYLPNVEIFQKNASAGGDECGFCWCYTEDGFEFWEDVIGYGNFELFFKKYPKKANLAKANLVYIIGDSEIGMDIIKTLEKYGGKNTYGFIGDVDGVLYYIEPNNNTIRICDIDKDNILYRVLLTTYTAIEPEKSVLELEVTMEEIAEKFGVDVNNLRIKK